MGLNQLRPGLCFVAESPAEPPPLWRVNAESRPVSPQTMAGSLCCYFKCKAIKQKEEKRYISTRTCMDFD